MRNRMPGPVRMAALLTATAGVLLVKNPAGAAPAPALHRGQPRLAIASPSTGALVAGLVPVAVAFDAGSASRVTLVELWVDDLLYSSQPLDDADARGTVSIDWDTLRLRNGQHGLKVRAFSGHKLIAADSALVTVSNGGPDVVPPLVSFYSPLDGQTVSGNVEIGINATDNDQVALVGLFVNRQLKMMKSDPPFKYTLDTATLPLLNGRGTLLLEAWAYDRAQNRGVAKPIKVYVNNPINATPLEPDPKGGEGVKGGKGEGATTPHPPIPSSLHPLASSRSVAPAPARLSPLEALLAPPTGAPQPSTEPKTPAPAAPPAPQIAPEHGATAATSAAPSLAARPTRRLEVALAPRPSPVVKRRVPPARRPSRTTAAVRPHRSAARLDAALGEVPDTPPAISGTRSLAPGRSPAPHSGQPVLKPAPVRLNPSRVARVPAGELVAVPQLPPVSAAPPRTRPASRPKSVPTTAHSQGSGATVSGSVTESRAPRPQTADPRPVGTRLARSLPEPIAVRIATVRMKRTARPARTDRHPGLQQGSTPDRIVLPVYRLARLPDNLAPSRSYTVRPGDTLSQIARQHDVTPRSVLVASGLQRASEITPGTRLTIPGTFTIAYNDEPVGFDVQPRVERGMAIAPFRQIFEHTGGVVQYQPADREVLATNPGKQVQLKIGSREALVNSAVVLMDRAAFLDSGRTMVPVKFMTEALDLKAEYDLKTGAIYLIHK